MNKRPVMIATPNRKANSFKYLFIEIENSSTMTSEQAMYKKDPAARLEKTISVIGLEDWRAHPMPTPRGVKIAKRTRSLVMKLS